MHRITCPEKLAYAVLRWYFIALVKRAGGAGEAVQRLKACNPPTSTVTREFLVEALQKLLDVVGVTGRTATDILTNAKANSQQAIQDGDRMMFRKYFVRELADSLYPGKQLLEKDVSDFNVVFEARESEINVAALVQVVGGTAEADTQTVASRCFAWTRSPDFVAFEAKHHKVKDASATKKTEAEEVTASAAAAPNLKDKRMKRPAAAAALPQSCRSTRCAQEVGGTAMGGGADGRTHNSTRLAQSDLAMQVSPPSPRPIALLQDKLLFTTEEIDALMSVTAPVELPIAISVFGNCSDWIPDLPSSSLPTSDVGIVLDSFLADLRAHQWPNTEIGDELLPPEDMDELAQEQCLYLWETRDGT